MDTQSSLISSSQGSADGQISAAKESKLSDSFLSASPVSLIQSPQDKRGVLGSDKSTEGVATSLRFSSQPCSFASSNYSSDTSPTAGQQDSPIKASPVSERIKALEALAAKKEKPDFRGNGTFTHFRERHEKSAPEGPKSTTDGPKATSDEPTFAVKGPQSSTEVPKTTHDGPKSSTESTRSPAEVTGFPPDKMTQTLQKTENAANHLESPESPFEIIADLKHVPEFEETEQWMKKHLPPVPDFDPVSLKESDGDVPAAFAGVPDAFLDRPDEKQNNELVREPKEADAGDFDLSCLPTAHRWDHQEKSSVEDPSTLDLMITVSPAPPAEYGCTSPPSSPPLSPTNNPNVSSEKTDVWVGEPEQPEANEGDSSGESDDTVIEDHTAEPGSAPPQSLDQRSNDDVTAPPCTVSEEKGAPPPRVERKPMQVPTINVIESDEPNYSEEEIEAEAEDDDYEVVKGPDTGPPNASEPDPSPRARPIETEFMEGYSPPSSPVDSEPEYSPEDKTLNSPSETTETPASHSEASPNPIASVDSQPCKILTTFNESTNEISPFVCKNEEVDSRENDDWSDETQEILFKPLTSDPSSQKSAPYNEPAMDKKGGSTAGEPYVKPPPAMSSFMQDDIYDRQSFDYDFDIDSSLDHTDLNKFNAKERFLSNPGQTHDAEDKLDLDSAISLNGDDVTKSDSRPSLEDYPENPYSYFQSETMSSNVEQEAIKQTIDADDVESGNTLLAQKSVPHIQPDPETGHGTDDTKPDGYNEAPEPRDSFVEFMRECLKSKQDEEVNSVDHGLSKTTHLHETSPSKVMDFEQEHVTIRALQDLTRSQEEEAESADPQPRISEQNQPKSDFSPTKPSSSSDTKPICSQGNTSDGTHSSEADAIDEWVAEAYHLAEHVLTAILTHLSVNDLIHWRDPKKSGVVFGLSLLLLLSLAAFSVISVVSYLLLALLCVTITFRIYKSVVQAVQKSSEGHPFKALIEKDVSIPPETFRKHVDISLTHINRALKQMSRLFLVQDLVDSLKLAVVMWLLTYVGAVFNGITILILADILLFAVPPVYEKNKTKIDHYIDLVRTQVNNTIAKLQEKLPGAMKRSKTE